MDINLLDNYYPCEDGYFAPYYSMTICMPCINENYKHSRQPFMYCLPNDTPKESQFVLTHSNFDHPTAYAMIKNAYEPAYFNTAIGYLALFVDSVYNGTMVVFRNDQVSLDAYGSTKDGKPTQDAHEYGGHGNVVTFVVSRNYFIDPVPSFSPFYFALQSSKANTNVSIYIQPSNTSHYVLTEASTSLNYDLSSLNQFFLVKAEQGARYNISVASIRVHPDEFYCYQYLYMDEQNNNEPYPNAYNGKIVAQDVAQNYTRTVYTTKPRTETGNLYFTVLTNCWARPIQMQIDINKV